MLPYWTVQKDQTIVEPTRLYCVSTFTFAQFFFFYKIFVIPPSHSVELVGIIITRNRKQSTNLPTRALRDKPLPFSAHTNSSVITELIALLPQAFPKINVSFLEKSCFLDCVHMVYLCGMKGKKKKKPKTPQICGCRHIQKGLSFWKWAGKNTSTVTCRGHTTCPGCKAKSEVQGSLPGASRSYCAPQRDRVKMLTACWRVSELGNPIIKWLGSDHV